MKKNLLWNIVFILVFVLLLFCEALTVITIIRLDMLPDLYLYAIIGVFALFALLIGLLLFIPGKRPGKGRKIVACVLTLIMGSYYLQQQALSTSSQKKIASLESELAEVKKVNADDLNRIETSVNLEEIRDIAINELGMIYATQENVVLYKNTSQNYVSQYDDVPQEAESLIKSIIKSK